MNSFKLFLLIMALTFSQLQGACRPTAVSSIQQDGLDPWFVQVAPTGSFVAVSNTYESITLFAIDPATGAIDESTQNTTQLTGVTGLAISLDGSCLVATCPDKNRLFVYQIDEANGSLSPTQIINLKERATCWMVAFSPDGKYLAASYFGTNEVAIFQKTENVSRLSQQPIQVVSTAGQNPFSLAFSQTGNCLACANFGSNTVDLYSVDPQSGQISLQHTLSTGGDYPEGIAFSPQNDSFSISHAGSIRSDPPHKGTVSFFSFNDETCTANLAQDMIPAGSFSIGVGYSQDGGTLFVANNLDTTISMYHVDSNFMTLKRIGTLALDQSPCRLAIFNGFLYVGEGFGSGTIASYNLQNCP